MRPDMLAITAKLIYQGGPAIDKGERVRIGQVLSQDESLMALVQRLIRIAENHEIRRG